MATDLIAMGMGEDAVDPTIPAPMTNVAEYAFEGRFEDWAEDAHYFEYSKAANPIGSGHTSRVPIKAFGRDLYVDGPTRVIPLDLSDRPGHQWRSRDQPGVGGPLPAHPCSASRSTPARTRHLSCTT